LRFITNEAEVPSYIWIRQDTNPGKPEELPLPLPRSVVCQNELWLINYPSEEEFKEKFSLALLWSE